MSSTQPDKTRPPRWITVTLTHPWPHIVMGILILLLDLITGDYLLFPILFVVPVTLSAWFYRARMAYALAVILPVGHLFIAEYVEQSHPLHYIIANAAIRMAVLTFLAYLVVRTSRQTKELEKRIFGLVTMCAWSRTIKFGNEWISFEE